MERTGDAGIAWRNFCGAGARTTQYGWPDRQIVPHIGRRSATAWGHLQEKRRCYRARLDAAATTKPSVRAADETLTSRPTRQSVSRTGEHDHRRADPGRDRIA